jgi:flagellar motor switch/type III secretory pathway protein FliN
MADGAQQDVLGQKAQAAQRAYEARGMSPAKALRRALSRTADAQWGLALVTQDVQIDSLDQDGVIAGLSGQELLVLIDGPDGAVGLVAIDRDVMTGLIEVQTIQQVTQIPIEPERVLTPTDAAMMAPLVDGALTRMAAMLLDHPLHYQLDGYRFGAMIEDARGVGLILDASGYTCFRAEVDLALGRRRGGLFFCLPERARPKPKPKSEGGSSAPGPHADLMSRVPARLEAVLGHISLPLARAQQLKPGDLIPLAPDALEQVNLVAGRGRDVVTGRLGQLNGMRAVRISLPVSEADLLGDSSAPPSQDAPETAPLVAEPVAAPAIADPVLAMPDDTLPEPMTAAPDAETNDFDFGAEAADFDLDFGANPDEAADLPDLDGGFAAAPVEFDFEEPEG